MLFVALILIEEKDKEALYILSYLVLILLLNSYIINRLSGCFTALQQIGKTHKSQVVITPEYLLELFLLPFSQVYYLFGLVTLISFLGIIFIFLNKDNKAILVLLLYILISYIVIALNTPGNVWRITVYFAPLWAFLAGYVIEQLLEKILKKKREISMFIIVMILITISFLCKIDLNMIIQEHERQDNILDIYSYIGKELRNITKIAVEKNYEFKYLPIFTHIKEVNFFKMLNNRDKLRSRIIIVARNDKSLCSGRCKQLYSNKMFVIMKC